MQRQTTLDSSREIESGTPPLIPAFRSPDGTITLYNGDCLKVMSSFSSRTVDLVVTSPPYNLGKEYERERVSLNDYLDWHARVISECCRITKANGSICWQV